MADTTFLVAALGQILGGVTIVTDLGTRLIRAIEHHYEIQMARLEGSSGPRIVIQNSTIPSVESASAPPAPGPSSSARHRERSRSPLRRPPPDWERSPFDARPQHGAEAGYYNPRNNPPRGARGSGGHYPRGHANPAPAPWQGPRSPSAVDHNMTRVDKSRLLGPVDPATAASDPPAASGPVASGALAPAGPPPPIADPATVSNAVASPRNMLERLRDLAAEIDQLDGRVETDAHELDMDHVGEQA
ncbi:hypothetical protein PoHVEF18_009590 [Penicillium ochrochloron]